MPLVKHFQNELKNWPKYLLAREKKKKDPVIFRILQGYIPKTLMSTIKKFAKKDKKKVALIIGRIQRIVAAQMKKNYFQTLKNLFQLRRAEGVKTHNLSINSRKQNRRGNVKDYPEDVT